MPQFICWTVAEHLGCFWIFDSIDSAAWTFSSIFPGAHLQEFLQGSYQGMKLLGLRINTMYVMQNASNEVIVI